MDTISIGHSVQDGPEFGYATALVYQARPSGGWEMVWLDRLATALADPTHIYECSKISDSLV